MQESKAYTKSIRDYVKKHPGCYMSAVVKDTGIKKVSAAPVLTNLVKSGDLKREETLRGYKYFIAEKPKIEKKRNRNLGDEVNPLTKFFNDSLAAVRGGRAEV